MKAEQAFAELAAAAEQGRAPDPSVVRWLAERGVPALATEGDARTRSIALGEALSIGASKAPSRPEMTAGDSLRVFGAIGYLIQREERLIAEGVGKRAASAQAVRETAARFHRAERTIQSWRKTWGAYCMDMLTDARQRIASEQREALATMQAIGAKCKPRKGIPRR